jgi:signal transduction histidine kinase
MTWGWPSWSLRARLTVAATATIAVVLVVASLLLLSRVHASLLASVDDTARRESLAVADQVNGATRPNLALPVGQSEAVQVLDGTGHVVAASSSIEGEPALFSFSPDPTRLNPQLRTVGATPLGDGSSRVAMVATSRTPRYLVYVVIPLDQVSTSTAKLAAALSAGVPALLALLTGATWVLTGRALRPVERLRQQAADITVTDLRRRVDVPAGGGELGRLANTLNDLLDRLDDSLSRQRQFVADAAHELRSPVAAIRAQLEVNDRVNHAGRPAAATAESVRLSQLVENLLALAQLDASPQPRAEAVDLDDLAYAEVGLLRHRTATAVDTRSVRPVQVIGDPGLLSRAMRNLLDNAARYAASGITVTVGIVGDEAEIVVADDGPGIPTADRLRVLERFTRLDTARARDSGGVGLGLAIVNDVVTAHGGRLAISDNEPGTRVTMTFPLR